MRNEKVRQHTLRLISYGKKFHKFKRITSTMRMIEVEKIPNTNKVEVVNIK